MEKLSFVLDHVYIAARLHPIVSPAERVLALMNESQERMWAEFETSVIRAGVARLWRPSTYLGSYGDLESKKISAYVRRWKGNLAE